MNLPEPLLFVAGVPKAGTSSLFNWLADHPQVVGSRDKETRFFTGQDSHVYRPEFNCALGLEMFRDAFPEPTGETRLFVEATPTTIYSRTALDQIPGLHGAPRCLFILREPASQIRSLYDYFRNTWDYIPADMSFAAYLDAVRSDTHEFKGNELVSNALGYADYLPWLEAWHARLGPDRMKVCTFDRLQTDPRGLVEEICDWCDLLPDFYADYAFDSENESYAPKSRALQQINIAVRDRLPKGRFYEVARSIYRRLNTRAPDRKADEDLIAQLRGDFAKSNARLARAFGLDLSGWSGQ